METRVFEGTVLFRTHHAIGDIKAKQFWAEGDEFKKTSPLTYEWSASTEHATPQDAAKHLAFRVEMILGVYNPMRIIGVSASEAEDSGLVPEPGEVVELVEL